ncbi:hypothetical protein D1007_36496 [Hordeum vulgare]|nr:hypothetical protein D1007_36496 [Hordeum vulgare]
MELKKMADTVVAAKAATAELAVKLREMEAKVVKLEKEASELRTEREKTLSSLTEAEAAASDASAKLLSANNDVA